MEIDKLKKIEHIKSKLLKQELDFLLNMKNYLEIPIYVYGSILRLDYFPNKSDIDVAIFSNNIESTVVKLIDFLGVSNSTIKIFKKKSTNIKTYKTKTIWGFKTNYTLELTPITYFYTQKTQKRFEIMLYNKKHKKFIISNVTSHFNLPIFTSLTIYFLKLFYYYFFFSKPLYKIIKEYILNATKPYTESISILGTL
jgi:predicted nucleotidyltransferase